MLNLITKDNLGFTKNKCNCGILSKKNKYSHSKNIHSKSNNIKNKKKYKKSKTRKTIKNRKV